MKTQIRLFTLLVIVVTLFSSGCMPRSYQENISKTKKSHYNNHLKSSNTENFVYRVAKDSSKVTFKATKIYLATVQGSFTEFSGTIELNKSGKLSSIEGVISVNSINTNDKERDEKLLGPGYFNSKKFTEITFRSKAVTKSSIKATLSIKGIEKDLDFQIEEFAANENQVHFTLSSVVNKEEFSLNGFMSLLIFNDIEVYAKIVATRLN